MLLDSRRSPVAADGLLYIAAGAALFLGAFLWVGALLALPFAVATLFVVWFFRDPERLSPTAEGVLLAPADGTILCIEPVADDPDIGSGAMVSIFMSVFNVHINRAPLTGVVRAVRYHSGKFLSAFKQEAPEENERNEIVFEGPGGRVKCVQVAGLIARRIVCRLVESQPVTAGERFGLIKFGSRVDVYVPAAYAPTVSEGDRVRGALTVIAHIREPRA